MKSFYCDKPKGKFIALYSDGSGANLYWRLDDDSDGLQVYCNHDGDQVPDPETYFEDAGYCWFIDLPDYFKLWFENSY